jgi:cold shock protein
MPIGRVKRYNETKGYGFLTPDSEPGEDCFFHASVMNRAGVKTPKPGDPFAYEIGERQGKPCAISVEALRSWQTETPDTDTDDSDDGDYGALATVLAPTRHRGAPTRNH